MALAQLNQDVRINMKDDKFYTDDNRFVEGEAKSKSAKKKCKFPI